MKIPTDIITIVRVSPLSENFAKRTGFKFTDYSLHISKDNWIILDINWTADEKYIYDLKYVNDGGSFSSNKEEVQILDFKLKHRYSHNGKRSSYSTNFSIEAGIKWKKGGFHKYRLSHFCNTKYGVTVYFHPKGALTNWKQISSWQDEEYFG